MSSHSSGEGIRLVLKGKRKGYQLDWESLGRTLLLGGLRDEGFQAE